MGDLDQLGTEGRLPEAADLDQMSTMEQLALLSRQDEGAVTAVAAARDQIARAIDAAVPRLRRGGRLIEVGAGTPGRLAILDVAECGPTFGVGDDRVLALIAGGAGAVGRAMERGEDDQDGGVTDLRAVDVAADDVVVAVSASGRTPYVLGALEAASEAGALTVGVVNNPDSPVAAASDLPIEIVTGPEVVAGSTRLKAGTAQKLVLNAISTLVMVRLGYTHGDLMVGVQASNTKLRRRARRIVAEATGAPDARVAAALDASGGDAKVAIVMLLAGVDAATARGRLESAQGHVRGAVSG